MKLIINADDCGKSKDVNVAINHFIEAGKITSTTIMANMDDLDGAARLFSANIRMTSHSEYILI